MQVQTGFYFPKKMKGTQNETKKKDQDLYKLEIMTFADFETIMFVLQIF